MAKSIIVIICHIGHIKYRDKKTGYGCGSPRAISGFFILSAALLPQYQYPLNIY